MFVRRVSASFCRFSSAVRQAGVEPTLAKKSS